MRMSWLLLLAMQSSMTVRQWLSVRTDRLYARMLTLKRMAVRLG